MPGVFFLLPNYLCDISNHIASCSNLLSGERRDSANAFWSCFPDNRPKTGIIEAAFWCPGWAGQKPDHQASGVWGSGLVNLSGHQNSRYSRNSAGRG